MLPESRSPSKSIKGPFSNQPEVNLLSTWGQLSKSTWGWLIGDLLPSHVYFFTMMFLFFGVRRFTKNKEALQELRVAMGTPVGQMRFLSGAGAEFDSYTARTGGVRVARWKVDAVLAQKIYCSNSASVTAAGNKIVERPLTHQYPQVGWTRRNVVDAKTR